MNLKVVFGIGGALRGEEAVYILSCRLKYFNFEVGQPVHSTFTGEQRKGM